MSEMKHTPGPWEVSRTIDEGLTAVKAVNEALAICTFRPFRKNYLADAHLMALSPSMFTALSEIDGEAPAKEPHDEPTVGPPPGWRTEMADYVHEIVREAFEEGKARGRWEAAELARAAIAKATNTNTPA